MASAWRSRLLYSWYLSRAAGSTMPERYLHLAWTLQPSQTMIVRQPASEGAWWSIESMTCMMSSQLGCTGLGLVVMIVVSSSASGTLGADILQL